MKRVLLAGFLGALGMFVWMFVAHMASSLGTIGIHEVPNEAPVLAAMQSSIGNQPGMYLFPAAGLNKSAAEQREEMKHYQEKLDANPSGLLIYHPPGRKSLTGGQLLTEFITEFLESFLASLLLARAALGSYAGRIAFVTTIGWVATITTNISYWNWYGFPTAYTLAQMFSQLIGFLIVGLIAGKILKNV